MRISNSDVKQQKLSCYISIIDTMIIITISGNSKFIGFLLIHFSHEFARQMEAGMEHFRDFLAHMSGS